MIEQVGKLKILSRDKRQTTTFSVLEVALVQLICSQTRTFRDKRLSKSSVSFNERFLINSLVLVG